MAVVARIMLEKSKYGRFEEMVPRGHIGVNVRGDSYVLRLGNRGYIFSPDGGKLAEYNGEGLHVQDFTESYKDLGPLTLEIPKVTS